MDLLYFFVFQVYRRSHLGLETKTFHLFLNNFIGCNSFLNPGYEDMKKFGAHYYSNLSQDCE